MRVLPRMTGALEAGYCEAAIPLSQTGAGCPVVVFQATGALLDRGMALYVSP